MTELSSPSFPKYGEFKITWEEYLSHIVQYDPDQKSVVINGDEEGNFVWEMSPDEARRLAKWIEKVADKVEQ